MEFLCSSCGACCTNVGEVEELPSTDGVCDHLDPETRECAIYEDRPLCCQIEGIYNAREEGSDSPTVQHCHKLIRDWGMSKESWFRFSTLCCHLLIDEQGLGEKYKVPIKDYDVVDRG